MAGKPLIGLHSVLKHQMSKPIKFLITFLAVWVSERRCFPPRHKVFHHVHLSEGCLEDRTGAVVWRNRRFEGKAPPKPFVTLISGKCDN